MRDYKKVRLNHLLACRDVIYHYVHIQSGIEIKYNLLSLVGDCHELPNHSLFGKDS